MNQFDSTRSIAHYFDNATRNALKSAANHLKPTVKLGPTKALLYCQREANVSLVYLEIYFLLIANSRLKSFGEDEEDNEDDTATMAIIKDVSMQLKQNRASIVESSEATFAEKYLMPIFRRVLLENTKQEIIYAM